MTPKSGLIGSFNAGMEGGGLDDRADLLLIALTLGPVGQVRN